MTAQRVPIVDECIIASLLLGFVFFAYEANKRGKTYDRYDVNVTLNGEVVKRYRAMAKNYKEKPRIELDEKNGTKKLLVYWYSAPEVRHKRRFPLHEDAEVNIIFRERR